MLSAASDLNNLDKKLANHAKTELHVNSEKAAENFRQLIFGKEILFSLSSTLLLREKKNRQIMIAILKSIILCRRQNLTSGRLKY